MQPTRRELFQYAGALTAAVSGVQQAGASTEGGHGAHLSPDARGVLVDLSDCVGCRLCEYACKKSNGFEAGSVESYDDPSVFKQPRRPDPQALTVVNAWHPADTAQSDTFQTLYAKVNCLHCNHAACVSACIVGALEKQPGGAVTYDSWKCIGCRYCMVACPFQIPTYEYHNALTPQVRKCEFCEQRTSKGQLPACVSECPRQAMTYGKRSELLAVARQKIESHPERYVDHIYGEHEVGGTSWLYLSPAPFEQAGFLKLGQAAPPALTEAIQHGVFKHWIAPIGWYGFLALSYWWTGRSSRHSAHHPHGKEHAQEPKELSLAPRLQLAGCATGSGSFETSEAEATDYGGPLEPPDEAEGPIEPHSADKHVPESHAHQVTAQPVPRKLLTPGVWALIVMVLAGLGFGVYRFIFGLAAATNLDQQHPWGLWIAMDVGSGIALAGGGFVTAALVHIFHREHYHAVARSALLTALLGYTFYVPGLLADLGRWYNLWHPTIPTMWQGNSVLFEVGLCVMIYLNVQYAELMPIICERFMGQGKRMPRISRMARLTHDLLEKIMPALLILGVALSTFHQSSLGNLMVIAPYKLHALWWSPVSPIFFLLSAMMVGFPMVIFTILFASWCLKRRPEMHVLGPLSLYAPVFLTLYLGVKVGDMAWRHTYTYLGDGSLQGISWIVETVAGVIVPLFMLLLPSVRRSPRRLATACLLIILGVVLNRLNVFIIGYHPPFATRTYFPTLTEMALSLGLVAALMLAYRVAVTFLPILEPSPAMSPARREVEA